MATRNSRKHGLYNDHIPPAARRQLQKMPADDPAPELAALRITVKRAMDLYTECTTPAEKCRAILAGVAASNAVANLIFRTHSILAESPARALEEAMLEASRLEGLDEFI